jgi:predicted porin
MKTRDQLLLSVLFGSVSAAFGQSSVTLFGIADATVIHGTGSTSNRTQISRGGLNTNRIGFRGTEDLGGGLSANFWLEAGYNLNDGSGVPSNTNNQASGGAAPGQAGSQGLTFGRRSTVSLASKTLGEIRFGRDYVPQYLNHAAGDPFGNVGAGSAASYVANISGVTNTRASNSVGYLSPAIGGFSLQLMHYQGNNARNTPNSNDGNGDGIRLAYSAGPLALGAAWGRTRYVAGDATQRNLHAAYNFGVFRLLGTLNRDSTGAVSGRGGVIGVVAPLGANELKASFSTYKTDAANSPGAKKVAFGIVHHLSKRTALYTTYAHVRNSGGSAMALNNAVTAPGSSSNGYDLGLRHAF